METGATYRRELPASPLLLLAVAGLLLPLLFCWRRLLPAPRRAQSKVLLPPGRAGAGFPPGWVASSLCCYYLLLLARCMRCWCCCLCYSTRPDPGLLTMLSCTVLRAEALWVLPRLGFAPLHTRLLRVHYLLTLVLVAGCTVQTMHNELQQLQ
jgi:hypothetical protein